MPAGAGVRHLTACSSTRTFLYAHQLQAKVANSVEDAIQVSLIADLADQDGLFVARFQVKPLESGPEVLGQAPPDRDLVPGGLHVCSDALGV
jgi:hypothetical protein